MANSTKEKRAYEYSKGLVKLLTEGLAKKLNREIFSELSNHNNYDLDDHGSNYNSTNIPVLKLGVKLPDSM